MLLRWPAFDDSPCLKVDDRDRGLGPESDIKAAALFIEHTTVREWIGGLGLVEQRLRALEDGGLIVVARSGSIRIHNHERIGAQENLTSHRSGIQVHLCNAMSPNVGRKKGFPIGGDAKAGWNGALFRRTENYFVMIEKKTIR